MRPKQKGELEYFKNDPWPVRLGALLIVRFPLQTAVAIFAAVAAKKWL
jgi:hypothetical protein